MLEVLIAAVVLAFGMLGIAGMLLMGHKSNSSSYIKQQAVQSAYDIVDRIRANASSAIGGSYNVNNLTTGGAPVIPTRPTDCSTAACTASQLATYDVWYWLYQDVAAQLPNGSGSIVTSALGANTLVSVTVQWDDSPAQKLGATTQTTSLNLAQFKIQTLL